VADLICKRHKHIYAVEITERGDFWSYKETLRNKIRDTKNMYKDIRAVYIISNKMKNIKSIKGLSSYFEVEVRIRKSGVDVCRDSL